MDQEQKRLEFMSRIAIFLPLVVLLLGFLISANKPSQVTLSTDITPTISTQEVTGKTKTATQSGMKLDLVGPYQCSYKDASIEVNVLIKNKKVHATLLSDSITTNLLVNGDCGYKWEEGKLTGEKMCNISQYLSMAEMLSSMNLMSFDSILSMVGEMDSSVSLNSSVMSSVAQSCKKQEVAEEIFTIPTNIHFVDYQSITPSIQP